jgi:ATP-dependent DNA ligase
MTLNREITSVDQLCYRRADGAVFLFAFDLLELNGDDLRREPIELRKRRSTPAH